MKKVLLLSLILSLVISLCACQNTKEKNAGKDPAVSEEITGNADETTDTAPAADVDAEHWHWTNGVYFNSYAEITFKTFDGWSQYTDEELLELQEADYANLDPVVKEMYKDRIIYAAYSCSEDKDSFFSVCYEDIVKLGTIRESKVTLDSYVSEYENSISFMYKDADVSDEGNVEFCGKTYRCLKAVIHSSLNNGVSIKKNIYFRQIGDNIVAITLNAGPYGNESIDDITARCKAMMG